MKGNVFQTWLKEFCALVFTQTIQAFILAVIMVLVMMIYNGGTFSKSDQTNATGVLAIIALTSISKMETLVKKMFGVESSITDSSMNGGKGGILGTVMAMKMLKQTADNIPKMVGGVKGVAGGIRDKRKAKVSMLNSTNRELSRYNALHSGNDTSSGSMAPTTGNAGTTGTSSTVGTLGTSQAGSGASGISGGTVTITNSNVNVPNGNNNVNGSSQSSKEKALKDQWALEDNISKIKDEYDQKVKAANDKIKSSAFNTVRGATETGGAFLGGALGGVTAAGMGTNVLKGMADGVGAGDILGKKMVDVVEDGIKEYSDIVDGITESISDAAKIKTARNDIKIQRANRANRAAINNAMKKFDAGDI